MIFAKSCTRWVAFIQILYMCPIATTIQTVVSPCFSTANTQWCCLRASLPCLNFLAWIPKRCFQHGLKKRLYDIAHWITTTMLKTHVFHCWTGSTLVHKIGIWKRIGESAAKTNDASLSLSSAIIRPVVTNMKALSARSVALKWRDCSDWLSRRRST